MNLTLSETPKTCFLASLPSVKDVHRLFLIFSAPSFSVQRVPSASHSGGRVTNIRIVMTEVTKLKICVVSFYYIKGLAVHNILVLIASASSEDSGKSAHLSKL